MENGESSTWLIVNFWSTSDVLTEQKKKNKRYLSTGFCFNYLQFSMRKYSLQIELRLFMRLRKILQRKIILTNTFYIHRSLFSSFPNLTSRLLFFFFFFSFVPFLAWRVCIKSWIYVTDTLDFIRRPLEDQGETNPWKFPSAERTGRWRDSNGDRKFNYRDPRFWFVAKRREILCLR